MQICSHCKIEKKLDEFYPSKVKNIKNSKNPWCISCHKENKKKHYSENKEQYHNNNFKNTLWLLEIKLTLKCERCGFNHPAALDFHHKDPNDKMFKISSRVTINSKRKEKVIEEMKKCIVLCSNCHRIEHSIRINKYLEGR